MESEEGAEARKGSKGPRRGNGVGGRGEERGRRKGRGAEEREEAGKRNRLKKRSCT